MALAACLSAAPAPPASAQDIADTFRLGGAVRFNYGWLDYGPTQRLQPELLRIDVEGRHGRFLFSLQYRWYDDFEAVHHAWLGWKPTADSDIRIGIQQAPFGLLPVAAHSFWNGSGYLLGIEDDYDPGIVWQREHGPHQWHAGVFFGDEYGSGRRYDRFSFDIAATDDQPYRERERVVARYQHSRKHEHGDWQAGISLTAGRTEDLARDAHYDYHAYALHGQWAHGPLSLQLQWARYRHAVPGDRIALAGFAFPFQAAADADVPTFNVAYAFGRVGRFDDITCYNDLSSVQPLRNRVGLAESWQNATGCTFSKGKMIAYLDWIAGKNMWFIGGPGIGIDAGRADRWRSRLNLNIGFYF